MKNIFAIVVLILISAVSVYSTNTNPTYGDDKLVHDNTEVSLTLQSLSSIITTTSYNESAQFFTIKTEKTINFLQVVNKAGDVDYLLPIGAKILKLALSDFKKGTFKINLLVEGESEFVTTELVKKI